MWGQQQASQKGMRRISQARRAVALETDTPEKLNKGQVPPREVTIGDVQALC